MLFLDIVIVSCSWFVFRGIETTVIGYLTMLTSMTFLDYTTNGVRQSARYFITSERREETAQAVCCEVNRGPTVLKGQGWRGKERREVPLIMARKRESRLTYRLIKRIDLATRSSEHGLAQEGALGEGFDVIKR